VRRIDPPATRTSVVAIWPEDMALTPRAAALVDYAVEIVGDYGRRPAHDGGTPATAVGAPHAGAGSGQGMRE
jgi:hypothetical protein